MSEHVVQGRPRKTDSSYMVFRVMSQLRDRVGRDQRGIGMIEVMASALVLAIVAVGLLSGFDVASKASGTNKSRSVAASIAQDDQERMRGLEVRTLVLRGPETRTVKAGSVTYSVKSTADPVSDSAKQGCTAGSTGVDYLRLKTEVTWAGMKIAPVVSDSLMAPRVGSYGADEGGLSVQVVDRDGKPRSGISIGLVGGTTYTDITDGDGCAFFAYIPADDYNVTFSTAGMVTPGGVQSVSDPVSVPVGAVANKVIQYDQAAALNVSFQTKKSSVTQADVGTSVTVAHPNIPAPGALLFESATPVSTMATGFSLFPFTGSYSVYSGACTAANPTNFSQTVPTITLGRGATGAVTVFEPAIDVTVQKDGTVVSGAKVRYYGITCPDVFTSPDFTDATGRLPKPGMPYGDYDMCVQYPASDTNPSRRYAENTTTVKNQTPSGVALTLNIKTTGKAPLSPTGSCPDE